MVLLLRLLAVLLVVVVVVVVRVKSGTLKFRRGSLVEFTVAPLCPLLWWALLMMRWRWAAVWEEEEEELLPRPLVLLLLRALGRLLVLVPGGSEGAEWAGAGG
jgi:hypothetical protein